jgi:pyruvate/2-oxoglutarate dehydrogenase complex dihydrolipoamide dehydrogenase (E3) component
LAGVETTERGFVKVNERLQTTAEGVWAIGDCAGNPHFTHISFDDFRVVRDNITGGNHVTTGRQVPFCLFTDPELARIGLSEREAKERGITYRLAKIPMTADLRTRTLSETRGFMKVLVDSQSDQILGFTMFGVMAGRGHGHGPGRDARRNALHGAARCRLHPSHHAGRTHPAVFRRLVG